MIYVCNPVQNYILIGKSIKNIFQISEKAQTNGPKLYFLKIPKSQNKQKNKPQIQCAPHLPQLRPWQLGLNNPKTFIEYANEMNKIYKNIEEYNSN